MILYDVKKGDTITSIANSFNVTINQIIQVNDIQNPDNLVIGECLIIKQPQPTYYTVLPGDNFYLIANKFKISINELLRLNPDIRYPYYLFADQKIKVAERKKKAKLELNGYGYHYTPLDIVEKSLPFLSYLSIFSYNISQEGGLIDIDNQAMINLANQYFVAPMMVIANIDESDTFSSELASRILNDDIVQNRLIEQITDKLLSKNYRGLNIDFEYIYPDDKKAYELFIEKINNHLKKIGNFIITVAVAPKNNSSQQGILYQAHDYQILGAESDRVIIMTYEWGHTNGPDMPVAPINLVTQVIDYATEEIPSNKILMGVPNYGYDFLTPYQEGQKALTIFNKDAVNYAYLHDAEILYDTKAQTPYFTYFNQNQKHIVYFEDPRSIKAKCALVLNKQLKGMSIWSITTYWQQLYEVIENYFEIIKIPPLEKK